MYEGDRGCLCCEQLQTFIAARADGTVDQEIFARKNIRLLNFHRLGIPEV